MVATVDYESRFVALETKLSYLEDFVAQLQEQVVAQTWQLEILREANKRLAGRYEELAASIDIPNRRPPHY